MLCIFCLKDRPPSEEHVFPEAIGGTLSIYRVCHDCNHLLNERADQDLIQHPSIRMRRATLRIPDKRGRTLDPYADIFGPGTIVGDGLGQKVVPRLDPITNKRFLQLVPHKTEKVGPNGEKEFEYKVDSRDADKVIPKIIERERKRAGRPDLSPSALDEMVSRVLAQSRRVVEENPVIRHELAWEYTNPCRGLLKIAYELAWRWLGDEYLQDETAQNIRQAILNDYPADDPCAPRVSGEVLIGQVSPLLGLWDHLPSAHLALIKSAEDSVGIMLRVFQTLSAVVIVSEQGGRYAGGNYSRDFIKLDPVSRTLTECNVSEAIVQACKERRAAPEGSAGSH